jgi:glyoxylase-like metal-dependent hydrolase (beta-lactamase superfamily II)
LSKQASVTILLEPNTGNWMKPRQIIDHVYQVGGAAISDIRDGAIYLLDLDKPVLIDSGAGVGFDQTIKNIEMVGFNPAEISAVILTHCHMDHIGGAARFRENFGSHIIMHALDAEIVERGDQHMTAAWCFGIILKPFPVDIKLQGVKGQLSFGDYKVNWIHIPGHTPGSIAVYFDVGDKRMLFGQDISAPLLEDFKCDPIAWRHSMDKLLALEADILCDGHAGVFRPKNRVRSYIERSIKAHGFDL